MTLWNTPTPKPNDDDFEPQPIPGIGIGISQFNLGQKDERQKIKKLLEEAIDTEFACLEQCNPHFTFPVICTEMSHRLVLQALGQLWIDNYALRGGI